MKLNGRAVWFGCILAFCALIAGVLLYPRESVADSEYDGKPLSFWLTQLDLSKSAEAKGKAQEAIDALGTNCIPHLLWLLRQEDSMVKEWGLWFDRKIAFIDFGFEPASVKHERALAAFRILGLRAEPFADDLALLLDRQETSLAATTALSNLGLVAVPGLAKAMTNDNPKVRASAALELGYRRDGARSLPLLLRALAEDPNAEVRSTAALALSRFQDGSNVVVSALITALDDQYPQVGSAAASSLGELGAKAHAAVPRLKQLAAAQGPLAPAASGALIKINPNAARESGIPITARMESFE